PPERSEGWAQRKGHDYEPEIRSWYEATTGLKCEPLCAEHDRHTWLRSSLDGWVADAALVVEAKYARKEYHREALADRVPNCYRPQILHQAMVTGAHRVDYVSFNPTFDASERYAIVPFTPDEEEMAALFVLEQTFWDYVTTCTPPPQFLRESDK